VGDHGSGDGGPDGSRRTTPAAVNRLSRRARKRGDDTAASCAALFERNGWTGARKNAGYPHHHYHSGAHEVLAIAAGWVRVRLGGETGRTVELRAGDVVVIPAGVAHKNEGASPDLLVVGAYPRGQNPDLRRPGGKSPRCLCPPPTRSMRPQGRCSRVGAPRNAVDAGPPGIAAGGLLATSGVDDIATLPNGPCHGCTNRRVSAT